MYPADLEKWLSSATAPPPTALNSNLSLREDPLDDPRQQALMCYRDRERWLDLGVVIFSQYFDTARWKAEQLAKRYPDEANALIAGAGRSRF